MSLWRTAGQCVRARSRDWGLVRSKPGRSNSSISAWVRFLALYFSSSQNSRPSGTLTTTR